MDNALNQYINLYKENTKLIDDNSAPVLNALRPDALQSLDGAHLPTRHTEGFEKTSIEEMFAPDYGVNISRVNIPVDVTDTFRCDVPNLSTLLGFVINDSFHPASKLESKLPEGVIFTSLRKAAAEHPEPVTFTH
ncbi:MAG: Fe-S cluster assembly protein SufD, partial [Duncaniella sp.]|nr:Fe-S cluster assembly protein SufD [Duncaniella sp.]